VDLASQSSERLAQNVEVLGRLRHEFACLTLGDLDVTLEDVVVTEAQLHCGNGHRLGNGAEVEHTLFT